MSSIEGLWSLEKVGESENKDALTLLNGLKFLNSEGSIINQ